MSDSKLNCHRYRVFFTKYDRARFIGHLDLQDLLARAIKRAKLPIAYSQGFNPHQLMSIALPLSLGMTGKAEIFEIYLTQQTEPRQIMDSLNPQMPAGMAIISVQQVANTGKSAAGLVHKATYRITFPNLGKLNLAQMMGEQEMLVTTKSKKGTKIKDILPEIFHIKQDGDAIVATLAAGSDKNLKPQLLAEYIQSYIKTSFAPHQISYERTELIL
ncbi:MAG: TIGR03936 family radical SAM-associated protein [Defluviitaleaceae bacterium]|nr:TIGR03936 family radical SAM-associated protein [Defluviitaleaceae bacterium]